MDKRHKMDKRYKILIIIAAAISAIVATLGIYFYLKQLNDDGGGG